MHILDAAQPGEWAVLIPDGATIVLSGNGLQLLPETLLAGLEAAYHQGGHPRDLTVYYPALPGTRTGTGIDHLAHPGLVRSVVTSAFRVWDLHRMADLVEADGVEAHCLPMGIGFQLLRAAAARQPGILSRVGLDTFLDPGAGGGSSFNRVPPTRAWVSRTQVDGEPYLFYRSPEVDVAMVRATAADRDGNLSLAGEPIRHAALDMAMAARSRGGRVLAEVRYIVRRGSLPTRRIDVPGFLVDAVLPVSESRSQDASLTGEWAVETPTRATALTPRTVMARRIVMLLRPGQLINLGYGIPTGVGDVLAEEALTDAVLLSVEHGPIGGQPAAGDAFGGATGPRYLLSSPDIFTLYHGPHLDWAILGAAQVDAAGNVVVHRFDRAMPGPGGFLDITSAARRLVFATPLTTGGTRLNLPQRRGAGVSIGQEGTIAKFVPKLKERTFSARQALKRGAEVWYVTDRASFRLTSRGLQLVDVAPGIDPKRDVVDQMGFQPEIAPVLERWPDSLYQEGPMGLAAYWSRG
jgi:acyl CoA:acetate/3-ketoacid CoA transferase